MIKLSENPEVFLEHDFEIFSHITPEAVRACLEGFALKSRHTDRWLAGSVRDVYYCTISDTFEHYPGTVHVRAELLAITDALKLAIEKFESRSEWAEGVMRQPALVAYMDRDDSEKEALPRELTDIEKLDPYYQREIVLHKGERWWAEYSLSFSKVSPEWSEVRQQINGLYSLRSYIEAAAAKYCAEDQPPRWRDMERRKKRITFAAWLSSVFENAYEKSATVNNWTDSSGKSKLGDWPDFFNRIACLALKVDRIPDLQGILKEARREVLRNSKVNFDPDFPLENHP